MNKLFYAGSPGFCCSFGLLIVRATMGVAFMMHGWPKIQNPMGWMGDNAPFSGILLACAAVAEFGGGIALLVGLLTPLASLGLIATMAVAISVHVNGNQPYIDPMAPHTYELPVIYLACGLLFLFGGPGCFSLDALLFGNKKPVQG